MSKKPTVEELQTQLNTYRKQVDDLEIQLNGGQGARDMKKIEEMLEVLSDPYSEQRPLEINQDIPPDEQFPQGQKLTWLSPAVISVVGMRGWEAIMHSDEYGKSLSKYLPVPPPRLMGTDKQDDYVRSRDLILARIDMRWFNDRQLRSELKCAKARGQLEDGTEQRVRRGATITGPGLTREEHVDVSKQGVEERLVEGIDHSRVTVPQAKTEVKLPKGLRKEKNG